MPADVEDQPGAIAQRKRPWPPRSIDGYTSRLSRCIHAVPDCYLYRGVVTKVERRGGTMQPIENVTVGEAFDRGKGLCTCWKLHYDGPRQIIPGAEIGHRA
jgi:hypothetical protein